MAAVTIFVVEIALLISSALLKDYYYSQPVVLFMLVSAMIVNSKDTLKPSTFQ